MNPTDSSTDVPDLQLNCDKYGLQDQ